MLDMCLSLFVAVVVGLALGLGALTVRKYIFVCCVVSRVCREGGCVYWAGRADVMMVLVWSALGACIFALLFAICAGVMIFRISLLKG